MLTLKRIVWNRQQIFGLLFFITTILVVCAPAFSISLYTPKIMVVISSFYFLYCLYVEGKHEKQDLKIRVKSVFQSAKWLFVAILLYYAWDLITMIYAKDYAHALRKIPYMLQYTMLTLMGIYFCNSKKRFMWLLTAIGLSGTLVSIGSYLYYTFSRNPIYFQRLSTARDYNVYACLILICFTVLAEMIIHFPKWSYKKKMGLFLLATLINIPSFYFAGSRRIFIMLPYFFAFAVLFESIRLFMKKANGKKIVQSLSFFAVLTAVYFSCMALLPSFTKLGTEKEKHYKEYVTAQIEKGEEVKKKPNSWNEKTIENVLETIEDKTMYSKRSIIYKVAFNELKTYSPLELAFGRGASYDIYMYDVTTDQELLDAYNISEKNPRSSGWLWAHNFLLADILNGGIIKVILALFLVFQLICHMILAIKKESQYGVLLSVPFTLVFVNNFISGAYGMLNDLFFHMMFTILIVLLYTTKKATEGSNE